MPCPHCGPRGWLFTELGPGQERWRVCINCGYEEYAGTGRIVERNAQRMSKQAGIRAVKSPE